MISKYCFMVRFDILMKYQYEYVILTVLLAIVNVNIRHIIVSKTCRSHNQH